MLHWWNIVELYFITKILLASKQLITNYRPISLLPILAKVYERIIFKNLYNYLISNNLITKSDLDLFVVVDSVEEAFNYLIKHDFYIEHI